MSYEQCKPLYDPYYKEIRKKEPLIIQIKNLVKEINAIPEYNKETDQFEIKKASFGLDDLSEEDKEKIDDYFTNYLADDLMLNDFPNIRIKENDQYYLISFSFDLDIPYLNIWKRHAKSVHLYLEAENRQWDFGAYGETVEQIRKKLDFISSKWLSEDQLNQVLRFLKTESNFQNTIETINQKRERIQNELTNQLNHIESLEDETEITYDNLEELKQLSLNVAFESKYRKLVYSMASRLKDLLFRLTQKQEDENISNQQLKNRIDERNMSTNISLQYYLAQEDIYNIAQIWIDLCAKNEENHSLAIETLSNLNFEINQIIELLADDFEIND